MEDVVVMLDDDCMVRDALADYLDDYFRENNIKVEFFSDLEVLREFCRDSENASCVKAGILDLWVPDNESDESLREDGGRIALEEIRKKSPGAFGLVVSAHLDEDSINDFRTYNRIALLDKVASARTIQRYLKLGMESV